MKHPLVPARRPKHEGKVSVADKTVLVETRGERKRRNLLPAFGVAAMNAIELSNIASCANPQGTSRGLFRQSRYGTIRTGNDRALALPG